jgi:hypothetical protein
MPPAKHGYDTQAKPTDEIKHILISYIKDQRAILDKLTELAYKYLLTNKVPTTITITYEQYKQLIHVLHRHVEDEDIKIFPLDKICISGCELSIIISPIDQEPFVSGDASADFYTFAQQELYKQKEYDSRRPVNCMRCDRPDFCIVKLEYNDAGRLMKADVKKLPPGWEYRPYGDVGGKAPYCSMCLEEMGNENHETSTLRT